MNEKYNISSDFNVMINLMESQLSKSTTQEEQLKQIQAINEMGRMLLENNTTDQEVKVIKQKVKSFDGAEIDIQIIEPHSIENNAPCLMFYHGGAFIIRGMEDHLRLAREYALKVRCKVIYVDYRLAFEFPFPTGVEDCYSALKWVYANANNLRIDTNRIAVVGDSAGGALSAAVTQMARDRKEIPVCFQMLCYPVTDSRQITKSVEMFIDTPIWNSSRNAMMWNVYLRNGDNGIIEYASPMQAKSFENLPTAYVEVAEFDPLRDEGKNYADALKENGIEVEFVQTKGTIHGYDMNAASDITKGNLEKRVFALKKAFSK